MSAAIQQSPIFDVLIVILSEIAKIATIPVEKNLVLQKDWLAKRDAIACDESFRSRKFTVGR